MTARGGGGGGVQPRPPRGGGADGAAAPSLERATTTTTTTRANKAIARSSSSSGASSSLSFPVVLSALLLLSLTVFTGLLYASINLVVFVVPMDRHDHHHRHRGIDVDVDTYHTYSFLRRPKEESDPSTTTTEKGDDQKKEEEEKRVDDGGDDGGGDDIEEEEEKEEGTGDAAAEDDDGDHNDSRAAAAADGDDASPRRTGKPGDTTQTTQTKNKATGTQTGAALGPVTSTSVVPPSQSSTPTLSSSSSSSSSTPYAYAFLLAGCDPHHPQGYRPLLSSIYVALHLLRKYGSTQDAIVYVMMAPSINNNNTMTTLPVDELRVLRELNAILRQIPTVAQPTFHRIMLQKFRILGLTKYRRVLFLDCDVMPLMNLDSLFELSDPLVTDPPLLQENVIFVDYVSPANGGTFLLTPHVGDLQFVNNMIREAQLIRNTGVEGKEPWRLFEPDPWEGFEKWGNQYDFHAVSGDQGLLWSWVRHYQRRFSYVVKDGSIRNYVPDDNDDDLGGNHTTTTSKSNRIRLESVIPRPFLPDHVEVWPVETSVWGTKRDAMRRRKAHPPKPGKPIMPHDEHLGAFGYLFHFLLAGGGKPWYLAGCQQRWDATKMPANASKLEHSERARRFWCHTYHEVALLHNLSTPASSLSGVDKSAATSHQTIGSEMWATPGPVTDLLEPDFDPLEFL